jgi:hypothetical protein
MGQATTDSGCPSKGTIQDIFYFTAAQESSTADQLRQYCRLKTGGPPTAVIIDVADNGASYPCHARVLTEETFANFVQQWRDGKEHAFKKQWFLIGPKGPNVADPTLKSKLLYLINPFPSVTP